MKNLIHISLALVVMLAACGKSKTALDKKKDELASLKGEIAALQTKAKKLEDEIAKLEPVKESGKLVETSEIAIGEFQSFLVIDGKADADQNTIATAQVPSTVTSVLVKPGQAVSAGQALAYLDNSTLVQSRLQLEQQVTFATTVFEKQKRLWQKGVGTEIQYLTAKNQKEALEKNLATLDAQIAMYTVKAPISGTIESVDTKVGQIASPGLPLFKVVNLSQMKIVADIAESYSGSVKIGDKAMVEFADIHKKFDSKITFASKVIDPMNRTFRIEISVPVSNEIKPNMLAKLKIVKYTNTKAISVPTNCIQSSEDGNYVVIAETRDGKSFASRKTVVTGETGDNKTEIISGLEAGEKIVVTGYQELNNGQEITVTNPKVSENK
ncbi:MAG: efflux RND transporter periplasmic adaptor subunit [Bacteroidetes bacterium]|nr:efflux RND transporter periplasmic adaptor subunit [Bacteroidota bacterium]